VLRAWTATEPAASEPAVTLVFEGGRFAGHAGCNRYTAAVEAGDQPGDIAVGPVAGTRMMCPEPAMATETRFLRSLGGAKKFTFVAGQLALTSEQDGTLSVMYFDRAAPR
jgi:heat shock protein HslJ